MSIPLLPRRTRCEIESNKNMICFFLFVCFLFIALVVNSNEERYCLVLNYNSSVYIWMLNCLQYRFYKIQKNKIFNMIFFGLNLFFKLYKVKPHRWYNRYRDRLECDKSWVWSPVGSVQRRSNWYLLLLCLAPSIKALDVVGSKSEKCVSEWSDMSNRGLLFLWPAL